ncbi:hypothetical protein [Microbacterium sp. Leaf179]|uniref:hypothetical protein n=1 Tax=Microbacterium sp. Leaf179 TaxID=1736288 RepID=UPI0006FBFF04|nr:hypothetical protein [Microbacterium sp. Leaf179]KQR86419.1 hypothetical protein ASF96_08550 [Microbacterium sp. Leaf179]
MSTDEDDELARLRRRAYSPTADIASDPVALARLAELERRAAEPADPPSAETDEGGGASTDDVAEAAPSDADSSGARRITWSRPRRSTIVLAVVSALVIVVAVVALVLVQRVQTHPLQADAVQVARLSPDPSYVTPDFFTAGAPGGTVAYTEFQGFRVVVADPGRTDGRGVACITVYQPDLLTIEGGGAFSYDGQYVPQACAAGTFPAATTIRLFDDAPERERTEYPADTALQFVYDEQTDEVVVFRG